MIAETETPRGVPGRPAGSSLQPPRPILIQFRVTADELARIEGIARARGDESRSSYIRWAALGQSAGAPRSAA